MDSRILTPDRVNLGKFDLITVWVYRGFMVQFYFGERTVSFFTSLNRAIDLSFFQAVFMTLTYLGWTDRRPGMPHSRPRSLEQELCLGEPLRGSSVSQVAGGATVMNARLLRQDHERGGARVKDVMRRSGSTTILVAILLASSGLVPIRLTGAAGTDGSQDSLMAEQGFEQADGTSAKLSNDLRFSIDDARRGFRAEVPEHLIVQMRGGAPRQLEKILLHGGRAAKPLQRVNAWSVEI